MKVPSDSSKRRKQAARRRDWRALPDTPEVPLRPLRHRDPIRCPKGGTHSPELVTSNSRQSTDRDEHADPWETTVVRKVVRCSSCHTETLAPELAAVFAEQMSSVAISRLLAARWCTRGHEYTVRVEVNGRIRTACTRCGKIRHGGRQIFAPVVKDVTLLVGAGVPIEAARAIAARSSLSWGPTTLQPGRIRL
jgi:hypothetical protein